jgi:ferredoxin-NADP reductase
MNNRLGQWLSDMGKYPAVLRRLAGAAGRKEAQDYGSENYRAIRQRVIGALHPPKLSLEVVDLIDETPTTRTLRMARTDGPMPFFRAGQYVNLAVELDGVLTSRPYSISSAPGEEVMDLTIREVPGGFISPYLANDVPTGSHFASTGPRGHFCYQPLIDGDNLVFVAGGSGITPFAAMLKEFAAANWPVQVTLIYGSRTEDEIIFRETLERLAHGHDRLTVHHVLSAPRSGWPGERGLLTPELLGRLLASQMGRRFFLCGPTAMVDLVTDGLARLGVASHLIRRELYGPPRDITTDPAWPAYLSADARVQLTVEGKGTFDVAVAEPLLNALERQGIAVRNVCRSGACGACRLKLLSGRVLSPEQTHLREADRKYGFIHSCTSYPLEDLVVRLP